MDAPLTDLPDEGVSWVIKKGLQEPTPTRLVNTLCAVSVSINKKYRKLGISKTLLQTFKKMAETKKIDNFIVPVRPTLKADYPLIPIEIYLNWKNQQNEIFDPWLLTHLNLGARIIKICQRSEMIHSCVSQWEKWTGMKFPGDGTFIVDGCLASVIVDQNHGTYIEPNVWVCY